MLGTTMRIGTDIDEIPKKVCRSDMNDNFFLALFELF